MIEETSLVAQQVRLRQWAEQIRDCQNRPEGMDVSTGVPCITLQKPTIITVLSVYGSMSGSDPGSSTSCFCGTA